jgi:hypothetical protein
MSEAVDEEKMNHAEKSSSECEGHHEEYMWYFTFGANMNLHTLQSRGIFPVASIPGSLNGYALQFTYDGYLGCEPRFANIEKIDLDETEKKSYVHGVAHRITSAEMSLLDRFEGKLTYSCYSDYAHKVCQGNGVAYIRFIATFEAVPDSILFGHPSSFPAQAYTALPTHCSSPGLPSKRYLKLLVDGATDHNLPAAYVAYLQSRPSFDCKGFTLPVLRGRAVSWDEMASHSYASVCLTGTGDGSKQVPGKRGAQAWIDSDTDRDNTDSSTDRDNTEEGSDGSSNAVWASVGSLVFDVSKNVSSRAMLQGMSNAVDGTHVVLRMWRNAYGEPVDPIAAAYGGKRLDCGSKKNAVRSEDYVDVSSTNSAVIVDVSDLDSPRKEYVASWVCHLATLYPFVGNLVHQEVKS